MLFIIATLLIVFLFVRHCRRNYGVLEKTGAPVVKPYFIFGSGPILIHKHFMPDVDKERSQKYGKVWGVYQMGTPFLNVADADVIRQITVKDFDHFTDHHPVEVEQKYRHMEAAKYPEWKELRKSATPMFTTGRLKNMTNLMLPTIDSLVDHLDTIVGKNGGKSSVIDIKPILQCTSMDIIAKVALATELNSFKEPENHLITMCREFFAFLAVHSTFESIMLNIILEFPFLERVLGLTTPTAMVEVWKITRRAQEKRAASPLKGKIGDLVDRILDIQDSKRKGELKTVSDEQITSLGNSFMVNGFDTIASTLATFLYNMAKHPDIQEQVIAEVDDTLAQFDGEINHDTVADMPLMEACILENLRVNSPVYRFDRHCTKDWSYKHLKVPRGVSIGLIYEVIHKDPEYWPEPELYKPERFFKDNREKIVPGSFQAFGMGPRSCIGERFAMMQKKITLAKLFQKFRFVMCDKTRLQLNKGEIIMNSFDDMFVKVERRS